MITSVARAKFGQQNPLKKLKCHLILLNGKDVSTYLHSDVKGNIYIDENI